MTESDTDKGPLDGDAIGPNGEVSPGKDGAADDADAAEGTPKKPPGKKPRDPNADRIKNSKKQTPEEREEERRGSEVFFQLVCAGGFDWTRGEWEPSKAQRDAVKILSFCGYTHEDIAYACGMSVETLLRHFEFELKTARMLTVGDLANRALTRARQGNDTMTIFLLKTRGSSNFSEKGEQARVLGETLKDAEGLTDEKKQEVIASLVELLNPKRPKPEKTTKDGDGE